MKRQGEHQIHSNGTLPLPLLLLLLLDAPLDAPLTFGVVIPLVFIHTCYLLGVFTNHKLFSQLNRKTVTQHFNIQSVTL